MVIIVSYLFISYFSYLFIVVILMNGLSLLPLIRIQLMYKLVNYPD
jgi:hypothetical protein